MCEAGVSGVWSAPTLGHRVLRAQGAVAEAPGYLHVASLPPPLPPAVLKLPELIPCFTVLTIGYCRDSVTVLVLLRQGSPIEMDVTMFRKKLGAIGFPDLLRTVIFVMGNWVK